MGLIIVVSVGPEDVLDYPLCGSHAVVALTPDQVAKQPDDTTLVCHPALGGCNHGFAIDPTIVLMGGSGFVSLRDGEPRR